MTVKRGSLTNIKWKIKLIKIRMKINDMENGHTVEKKHKRKNWSFIKIHKTDENMVRG